MSSLMSRLSKRAHAEASTGGAKVWSEILALAKPGVINLGQGFPDFSGHGTAREAALAALSSESGDQYTPITGSERLRRSLSDLYRVMYPEWPKASDGAGRALDPASEVCVTTSGTEAIYTAILGLVDPGDEVVFFEPFFPWYLPCIRLAGGVPRPVMLQPPDFDLGAAEAAVRAAFSPRTKLCIVNTPHNPTGRVASAAELELVASLCREHDAVCLSDEVYEACIYPGGAHRRMCEVGGMWERTLTVGSASKLLSLTGWRVGWVSGPAELVKAASTMHSYTTFCPPGPLQEGVAAALDAEAAKLGTAGDEPFEGRAALMHRNWTTLADALRAAGWAVCPSSAGYFLLADVSASGMADLEFCKWLAAEHKVAAVPLSAFFCADSAGRPTSLVRFAVCKEAETVELAAKALRGATLDGARAARARQGSSE